MPDRVKQTRRYNSPRRQEQAAATRARILEAAQRLFERQGYGTTSMAAIAGEAGVALQTVYAAFDTKPGVLIALWHLVVRGDQEATPVGEREWFRELIAEPDPQRQLRLAARRSRVFKQRAGKVMAVVRTAAAADAEIGALWERIQTDFHANQRSIVDSLEEKRALRAGLGVAEATDILWALNLSDLWQLLVGVRGWTPERYEQWLGELFCAELLGKPRRRHR